MKPYYQYVVTLNPLTKKYVATKLFCHGYRDKAPHIMKLMSFCMQDCYRGNKDKILQ